MKNYLTYFYIFTMFFVSCQNNEKKDLVQESQSIQESKPSEEYFETNAPDTQEQEDSESTYEDPKLFEYYHNLCSLNDWPDFVDGKRLIQVYNKYPNINYQGGFEWEIINIPYCTDELIFLHLQSFEEGVFNNYEVAINKKGLITQFNLAGEQQSGEVQMKMWDKNTVQVTIIDKNAESRNYFMDPSDDVFQGDEYGSSIGVPETTPVQNFELIINNKTRSLSLHTANQKGTDLKVYFDLYENNQLYFRLPPHPINDFAFFGFISVYVHDINGDSKDDIIINASAITGIGPEGAVPFDRVSVYFQTKGWTFKNEQGFDELINAEMNPEKIAEVFETQYL